MLILLLILCSCGGGESSESTTTRTTYTSNPVSEGEREEDPNSIGVLRRNIEIKKLNELWDRLNENGTAVRWERLDSDFRKAFKFGMLLEKTRSRFSSVKMDLILKVFTEASGQGMNPDFHSLAIKTLKEK